VADERARTLSQEGRGAVAEYLSVLRATTSTRAKRVKLGVHMHPSLKRAYEIMEDDFLSMLDEQDFFGTEKRREDAIAMMGAFGDVVRAEWAQMSHGSSRDYWDAVVSAARSKVCTRVERRGREDM
jgi:hypothetical protein